MAYKVSYKVVSEQGEQLKNIAKDMDNYSSQLSQIISKLGNDELLQTVRGDLNKFKKQLEEEKTVLNLAGQVIVDVIQSYTGVEKKSVQKVDRAKAHNRDFYKRPVSVPSAGGGAAAGAGATTVNINSSTTNVYNNTTVYATAPSADLSSSSISSAAGAVASAAGSAAKDGAVKAAGIVAGAAGMVAAGAGVAGTAAYDKKTENEK